jgi:iron-only hydrogenase group A
MLSTMVRSHVRHFALKLSPSPDTSTNSLTLDRSKCIKCGLCVKACTTIAGQGILKLSPTGIGTASGLALQQTGCIKCGQCTLACPTSAIVEKDELPTLEAILACPEERTLVVQIAPAVRINLAEALGCPPGTIATGKLVTLLKRLGFHYVFDTNWAADATIVEEAHELLERIKKGGPLPMFTSCCPAWVNYVEQHEQALIPHLSTTRSPLGIQDSVIKSDWVKLKYLKPSDVYSVAIMPCVAKKDEVKRSQMSEKGYQETDLVITTRELVRLIKKRKIDFKKLPESEFDPCYSTSSGAGAIFGGSGGVMEAAVRTAYTYATGKPIQSLDFPALRGAKAGIKTATVDFDGTKVGVAVAQGIANAKKLIAQVQAKDPAVAGVKFIEVMACPGGCVCGGGSPKARSKKAVDARVEACYAIDRKSEFRTSHENPQVTAMYTRMFEEPGSPLAHEYLHTHYMTQEIP